MTQGAARRSVSAVGPFPLLLPAFVVTAEDEWRRWAPH